MVFIIKPCVKCVDRGLPEAAAGAAQGRPDLLLGVTILKSIFKVKNKMEKFPVNAKSAAGGNAWWGAVKDVGAGGFRCAAGGAGCLCAAAVRAGRTCAVQKKCLALRSRASGRQRPVGGSLCGGSGDSRAATRRIVPDILMSGGCRGCHPLPWRPPDAGCRSSTSRFCRCV